MATSTPAAPAAPATPEAALASAGSALAAAMASTQIVESPVPPAPPASGPAAPATPAPPLPLPLPASPTGLPAGLQSLVPATPTPAPGQTPAVTPAASPAPPVVLPDAQGQPVTITDPDALNFLRFHGGDPVAALKAAMAYNNQLAALAKASPDMFKPGGPADPSLRATLPTEAYVPPTTAQKPPTAPVGETAAPSDAAVAPDWAKVKAEVDQRVQSDAQAAGLVDAYRNNMAAIQQANTEGSAKVERMRFLDSLLKDATVANQLPELQREELSAERRTLQQDINTLQQSILIRSLTNREIDAEFRTHQSRFFQEAVSRHQAEAREQALQSELTQLETSETQRITAAWPAAVQSAITAHQIPAEVAGQFADYAKQVALSQRAINPDFQLDDVAGFVHGIAPRFIQTLDIFHRARSAQYAAQATQRAASPAPPPPAGTPAAPAATSTPKTPEAIMDQVGRDLAARLRGRM